MIRERRFLDFEIQVGRNVSGALEVQVFDSPRDRPRSAFEPPYDEARALELLASLEAMISRDITGAVGETDPPKQAGQRLFESLFPASVRTTLDHSLDRRRKEGLRLRLSFDPEDDELVAVAALPWEILFHPGRHRFVAQLEDVAVVRYLDLPIDIQRLFVKPPLRVLLIAPQGDGTPSPSFGEEKRQVFEILQGLDDVEVESVEPPTVAELLQRLGAREFHVLHFIGHGGFADGESGLFFEDAAGHDDWIRGTELAAELEHHLSTVKLAVLNSCYGSTERRQPDQTQFGSVASAMVAKGLTAAVGMQFLISNDAAQCFARSFYETLAETGHVELAAVHARHQLAALPKSREWITPVVLTRATDGQLFDPSPPPSFDEPLQVGIVSIAGWGSSIEEWSHAYLPLTSFFRGRYLNEGVRWQQEIYPRVVEFLRKTIAGWRAIHIDFAAHQSIAFAAGYLMEAKAGARVTVRQRFGDDTTDWRAADLAVPGAPPWEMKELSWKQGGRDIALAVSPTRDVLTSVESYLEKEGLEVGRIIDIRFPEPERPSQFSVLNGWHAFRLAEAISNKIHRLTPGDWPGTFHLFYAGPNGLLFFLGRLSHGPRRIQLYEYDFDGHRGKSYTPSLVFPPPENHEP